MTNPTSQPDTLDEVLGILAEDLINYDKRMDDAGAPPVRFTHKYTKKTKAALNAMMAEIIGKDEIPPFVDDAGDDRNRLRNRQRQRAREKGFDV